jgi:hypothetical protein
MLALVVREQVQGAGRGAQEAEEEQCFQRQGHLRATIRSPIRE